MNSKFFSLPEEKQQGNVDMDRMEKDFTKLMAFWKSVYLRRG